MKKILLFIWIILVSHQFVSGQGSRANEMVNDSYILVESGYVIVGFGSHTVNLTNNGTLYIEKDGRVTVFGGTTNTGTFIVKSYNNGSGSFIPEGSVTGSIKVQRYVTGSRWNMISPSVSNETAGTLMDTDPSTDSWLTYFEESEGEQGDTAGAGWHYIVPPSTSLEVGKGYCYWPTNNETLELEGGVTHTDFPYTLSYSGSNYGFNLVGNPYTSPVEWDTLGGKWSLNNVDNTIWIYDGSSGNYNSYPSGVLTYNIALGQGFFVRATGSSPSMTAPENGRGHVSSSFVKRAERRRGFNFVAVKVLNYGKEDNVYIYFDANGTDDYDYGYDALKMFGSTTSPQLFVQEEKSQSYDFLPYLNEGESRTVHLNYIPGVSGEQKLIFDLSNFHGINIVLEDTKTGVLQDITENNVYEFTGAKSDDPARFLLHFTRNVTGVNTNNESSSEDVKIYSYANNIYVKHDGAIDSENGAGIYVYDITGRELIRTKLNKGEHLKKLSLTNYSGYVVVRVIDGGVLKTDKVFVK